MPRKAKREPSGADPAATSGETAAQSVPETPALQSETSAEQEAVKTPRRPKRILKVGEKAAEPVAPPFVPTPGVREPYRLGERVMATPSDIAALHHVQGFFPLPGGGSPDALYQVAVAKWDKDADGEIAPDGIWRIGVRGEVHGWTPRPDMPGWRVIERNETFEVDRPVHRPANPRPAGGVTMNVPDADFELPEHVNPEALIALGVPLPPEGYYREVYRNYTENFLRAATQSGDYFLNRLADGWMRWPVLPGTEATPAQVWPPTTVPPPQTAQEPPEWVQTPDENLSVRLRRIKHSILGDGQA